MAPFLLGVYYYIPIDAADFEYQQELNEIKRDSCKKPPTKRWLGETRLC